MWLPLSLPVLIHPACCRILTTSSRPMFVASPHAIRIFYAPFSKASSMIYTYLWKRRIKESAKWIRTHSGWVSKWEETYRAAQIALARGEEKGMARESALQVFGYEGKEVRTVLRNGEPWFVAADVCVVLEISNNRDAMGTLDDDEKGVAPTPLEVPRK